MRKWFCITSVFIVLLLLFPGAVRAHEQVIYVPIVLYHHIDNKPGQWHVTPQKLETELRYLQDDGYHTISMQTFMEARNGHRTLPDRPIILTFDDGDADAYTAAFPLLKKYGMTGTFYIITGFVGRVDFVTWQQVRDMQTAGMEIGAHTLHHPFLTRLSSLRAFVEIWLSKLALEFNLLKPVTTFAYPNNDHNSRIVALVRLAGFEDAVIVSPHAQDNVYDPFEMPRITILPAERTSTFVFEISAGKIRAPLNDSTG